MATLLEDMVTYLVAQGIVTGDGVDAFRDFAPNGPNKIVVLHEYQGSPTTKGVDLDIRNVQVTARAVSATEAKALCSQLYAALNKPEESIFDLTDTRWAIINAKQPPFKITIDTAQRVVYGFNINVVTFKD